MKLTFEIKHNNVNKLQKHNIYKTYNYYINLTRL